MIRKTIDRIPQTVLRKLPPARKAPSIEHPIKTSYGSELFVRNGVSYEKEVMPDGRIRLINLDTGDEVIGKYLVH